jgi:hypothetical protein
MAGYHTQIRVIVFNRGTVATEYQLYFYIVDDATGLIVPFGVGWNGSVITSADKSFTQPAHSCTDSQSIPPTSAPYCDQTSMTVQVSWT